MMSSTSGKAALLRQSTCFYKTETKPNHCSVILLSALAWLKPHSTLHVHIFTSHTIAVVNQLLIVILGSQRLLDNAANIFIQPLTSQRGGHCLLHTEITLPYQLSVEMKRLMFVCSRKVVAVNQGCSESCSNLSFINLSFEHTNDGALTTGSSAQARASDSCCDAVFLCVFKDQMREETAASTLAGSSATKSDFAIAFDAHIHPLTLNRAWFGPDLCRLSTHNLVVKGHSCSWELITRQDKLRKG